MALTQDDKIRSSPRASKDPKSYEYARQMVYVLKTCWKRVRFDLQDWEKEVGEAKQNKIWEQLGYASIDEVLAKEVGYSEAELKLKCKQARDNPLADVGEIGNGRKDESRVDNVNPTKGGNDTDYTLRRLARDNPELLDAIERGELSVNAAAIQAGIRKKPTHAEICVRAWKKTDSRLAVLKLIMETLQAHEWEYVQGFKSEVECIS